MGRGRKGYPGNKTIVQNVDPRPGGAAASVRVFAVCGSPSSFICEPQIEELWKKHETSTDPEVRDEALSKIQHYIVENYLIVPIYLNPFVHAVGPRVMPDGDKEFHRYWATANAPYPWPWEVWEVKADK
jgi:ABC-type transport system substrate-binding protein